MKWPPAGGLDENAACGQLPAGGGGGLNGLAGLQVNSDGLARSPQAACAHEVA